jgi:hypothetical protein
MVKMLHYIIDINKNRQVIMMNVYTQDGRYQTNIYKTINILTFIDFLFFYSRTIKIYC